MRSKLVDILQNVLEENSDVGELDLSNVNEFKEIEGWDSVNKLYFILEVEKTFKLEFDIEEMESVNTIDALISLINSYS